jgi:hypothetical protein
MSKSDMQFTKRTVASPFFDRVNHGQSQGRIGAEDGPAGGEVRREKFANNPMARPARVATDVVKP